jgi:predicted nucleic acid-binding protein
LLARSRELLSDVHLIRLDAALLASAAQIEPLELRSLDAIHLAAAAGLGMQLEAVLSYDVRMLGAAVALGLPTASPA